MKQDSLQQVLNISLQFGVKIVAGRSTAAYLSFLAGPRPARATGCCTAHSLRSRGLLDMRSRHDHNVPAGLARASDYFITEIFYQPLTRSQLGTATDHSRTSQFFFTLIVSVVSILDCIIVIIMTCIVLFIMLFVKHKYNYLTTEYWWRISISIRSFVVYCGLPSSASVAFQSLWKFVHRSCRCTENLPEPCRFFRGPSDF